MGVSFKGGLIVFPVACNNGKGPRAIAISLGTSIIIKSWFSA